MSFFFLFQFYLINLCKCFTLSLAIYFRDKICTVSCIDILISRHSSHKSESSREIWGRISCIIFCLCIQASLGLIVIISIFGFVQISIFPSYFRQKCAILQRAFFPCIIVSCFLINFIKRFNFTFTHLFIFLEYL